MRRTLQESRIVLTGASSGIGRALAHELAREGAHLLLIARREPQLRSLAEELRLLGKGTIEYLVGDITTPETRDEIVSTALNAFQGIDILINNAGTGAMESVESTSEETARKLFEVNFFAPFLLTQQLLPELRRAAKDPDLKKKKRFPLVVNLCSIVGIHGLPHYGVYGATKGALHILTEAMQAELTGERIGFLLVCPGTTKTEFFDVLLEKKSAPKFPYELKASASHVARAIVSAMKSGKSRIFPHLEAKVLEKLTRFCPCFANWLVARFR